MKLVTSLSRSWRPALALVAVASTFAPISHADAPTGRFTVAAGIVTDTQTGLQWQAVDDGKTYAFVAAEQHCVALGGSWRAPSMKELQTIVDESRAYPAVDTSVFTSIPSSNGLPSCYQTSTPLAGSALGWLVCFDFGRPTYDTVNDAYKVLCVR
ncbi:MAG TPA: DUF1566 domain-containing protein [Polyangiaceae bacterium]|jgi:hypothetical protein|nr:DUF1566 domain-containing protein [Polyangiaceae bacterium]